MDDAKDVINLFVLVNIGFIFGLDLMHAHFQLFLFKMFII